jgi:hypothetical protein
MKIRSVNTGATPVMSTPACTTPPSAPPGLLPRTSKRHSLRSSVKALPRYLQVRLSAGWSALRTNLWHRFARAAVSRPGWVAVGVWGARRLAPRHHGLAWLEALLVARRRGWAAAAPRLRAIAEAPLPADLKAACRIRARAAALLPPPRPGPTCRLVVPTVPRPVQLPAETGRRIVIYTARLGEAGAPAPMFGLPEGVRCLCFTDRPQPVHGWEMHATTLSLGELKATPQAVLASVAPEAEFSLWLDPDREVVGNLHTFFGRWLANQDLVMARHAATPDWHALAERAAVEGAKGVALEAILAEVETCATTAVPRGRGACDTGVIWRRHGAAEVAALGAAWLALRPPEGGPADDIAFYRLVQGTATPELRPAILPEALTAARGDARDTAFTAPIPRPRQRGSTQPGTGKLPITFLYGKGTLHLGLSFLRGGQMSALIRSRFPDAYEVTFTDDFAAVRDQVVIANITVLRQHGAEELAALRARNIALIGDWLDGTVHLEKAETLTANMAFCLRQAIDLSRTLPERPTFHVTHHVNTDIPFGTPPQDRLRTGYFGASFNTWRPESLSEVVNIVETRGAGQEWIRELGRYNCHWLVRVDPGFAGNKDGWKPFLKGFVAARCGAPVITTRDDPNALHYLGDDYPFYADSLAATDLELAWARVAGAFGGPDWQMAREIMRQTAERSSDEQVCLEFKAMLDTLLG